MNPSLSIYLNVLRALAALAVYLYHARAIVGTSIPFIDEFGLHAVTVFFVLSGLVIMHASLKYDSFVDFMKARFARLWSVSLAALALTFVLDNIGQAIHLAAYSPLQPFPLFKWVAVLGVNSLFLNQIWFLNIWPGSNGPFWSLSYEFWYYVLFATAMYLRGARRVVACAVVVAIMGPKILQALPVWLIGVVACVLLKRARPSLLVGITLFGGSIAMGIAFTLVNGHQQLIALFPEAAQFSAAIALAINFWPESYLIGFIVALNIYGFNLLAPLFHSAAERYAHVVRTVADTSFGLYLFHYPLMYFVKAVLMAVGFKSGGVFVSVMYVVPLAASIYLAVICERRKHHLFTAGNWASSRIFPQLPN